VTTYLLDVNVLVALFDPAHVHHEPAHRWFAAKGAKAWATCPITENGLVRILSSPAYPTVTATPAEVISRLRTFKKHRAHRFWEDALSLCDDTAFDAVHLAGHQKITDAYLAGLAAHHGGRLVTVDRHMPAAAILRAKGSPVEVIAA
jgi:hypothetical protein